MDTMTKRGETFTFDIPIGENVVQAPAAKPPRTYKNIEMEQMIAALEPLLERTDKIGYAAARNTRILRTEAQEYFERREQLIAKYGEPKLDEDGNPTGLTQIRIGSEGFAAYAEDIEEWALIEHSPQLFILKYEEAIGKLSGAQILDLDWMFED